MSTVGQEDAAKAAIARWRQAPVDPTPLTAQVQRGRRRFRGGIIASSLALGIVSGLVAVAITRRHGQIHHQRRQDAPGWAQAVGTTIAVLSLLLLVGALVWAWRRGRLRDSRRSPLWALTWRERNRALKQMRGRLPYTPEQVPLLRMLATGVLRNTWYRSVAVGAGGSQVGQVFLHWGSRLAGLSLFAAGCLLALPVSLIRQAGAARTFLHDQEQR